MILAVNLIFQDTIRIHIPGFLDSTILASFLTSFAVIGLTSKYIEKHWFCILSPKHIHIDYWRILNIFEHPIVCFLCIMSPYHFHFETSNTLWKFADIPRCQNLLDPPKTTPSSGQYQRWTHSMACPSSNDLVDGGAQDLTIYKKHKFTLSG